MGATASGAPASGTFEVGDYVIDQTGIVWICTAAGTPGTWVDASSSGRELGSVEKTDGNFTSTTIAGVDVTGMSLSFTVGARPVYVWFGASDMSLSAAGIVLLSLLEGATTLEFIRGTTGTGTPRLPVGASHARISTPGPHTVKLQMSASAAGTMTLYNTANNPIFLRAVTA